ncbi:hypothetical protein FRB95_001398 [Tulasnella sp. JGI-2019a]|nr:hypothetical protein FRB95_001398 [Tulasnella sp. JGI-2019a]
MAAINSRPEWYPRLMEHTQRCGDHPLDLSIVMDVARNSMFFKCFNEYVKPASELQLLRKVERLRMICRQGRLYLTISDAHGFMYCLGL